jgi:hypothetical protein
MTTLLLRIAARAAIVTLCALPAVSSALADVDTSELEFPADLAKKELKAKRLTEEARSLRGSTDDLLVILRSNKWKPGKTLTVAFFSGDSKAHERIERVVTEWTKYANIKFDFGRDANGNYRRWTEDDVDYAADIRISFNAVNRGNGWWRGWWSALGTSSSNPEETPQFVPSMNLQGFDGDAVPQGFRTTVLHEFGHALGLAHEHQHPATDCDWRWDDEPGYVLTRDQEGMAIQDKDGRYPGIYTVLTGPPEGWSRQVVDANLRKLENQSAYDYGAFDKNSIMKYFFADWMYIGRKQSPCYSARVNAGLSAEDKLRIAEHYPADVAVAVADIEKRKRVITDALSQLSPSSELAKELRFKLKQLE